jgi:hypothetical protein
MVDQSTIVAVEQDVNVGMRVAKQILPFLLGIPGFGAVGAALLSAINGIQAIENAMGIPTEAAAAEVVAHNTQGAPNSPTLSGSPVNTTGS